MAENIIDELLDLKESFIDDKDYKGYMVKQVIDARLRSGEVRSDLVEMSQDTNTVPLKSAPKTNQEKSIDDE